MNPLEAQEAPLAISREEFLDRQHRAVDQAHERGFDGLLVWSRGGTSVDYYGDVMYLANHHSPFPPNQDGLRWSGRSYSALVLPVDGEPVLVADLPESALGQCAVRDVRSTVRVPETAAAVLREKGLTEIGVRRRQTLSRRRDRTPAPAEDLATNVDSYGAYHSPYCEGCPKRNGG